MSQASTADALLVKRIRSGEPDAWSELIAQFEGRLLAFVESRLRSRSAAEDIVQEAFIGLLTSLPNYDAARPLEGYLFSIAAHKLTDHLRREGRRPAIPFPTVDSSGEWEPAGPARAASSILRSGERHGMEKSALAAALRTEVDRWKERGDWDKLKCIELLFVRGWTNKEVAVELELSEQQVANFKFDFVAKIRRSVRNQDLPRDVFPELYEE